MTTSTATIGEMPRNNQPAEQTAPAKTETPKIDDKLPKGELEKAAANQKETEEGFFSKLWNGIKNGATKTYDFVKGNIVKAYHAVKDVFTNRDKAAEFMRKLGKFLGKALVLSLSLVALNYAAMMIGASATILSIAGLAVAFAIVSIFVDSRSVKEQLGIPEEVKVAA